MLGLICSRMAPWSGKTIRPLAACWRLCAWWEGCISILCVDECDSRSGSWCAGDCDGYSTSNGGEEGINPYILVAAAEAGVKEMYRIGGAQAVAALAYGTESIRPVDKIVGPGNIYVALAKRYVFGVVDIDSIAGPSEIVVLADDSAEPAYIAADLLSQAEHDEMASAVSGYPVVTLSRVSSCRGRAAAGYIT